MFRIQAIYQSRTYHLNKTYSSGGIGNRISLININEDFTIYESIEAVNKSINTFKRCNQHQKIENIERLFANVNMSLLKSLFSALCSLI